MKSAFAQIRAMLSDKRRLAVLKKVLIRKCNARHIFENWKINSSTAAIGCEFEI